MPYSLYLLLNGGVSAIIAILLWYGLPKKFQQPRWPITLLFFSISMCVPIIGILFLIIAVILSYWFERKVPEKIIQAIFSPTFMREKVTVPTSFGESGAWVRLHSSQASNTDRMQAMVAINTAETSAANRLNMDMLQNENDQLRLYAFGLIDKRTKQIDQRISKLKQQLVETEVAIDQAKIKKSLALLYWEMVFTNLVKDDLLTYAVTKTIEYTSEALEQMPEDMGLWVLSGKIYFYKKEYSKAKEAFEKAEKFRAPYEKILPYLAELSFKERDFAKIREYLSLSDTFRYMPKLYNIAKFWGASWKKR